MKTRKGYQGEYLAKKELIDKFGSDNVIKIAIAQIGADFMVIMGGKLVLLVEVKETIGKKYYPKKKEKEQFNRIYEFAKRNKCLAELWVYYRKGSGKPTIKEASIIHQTDYQALVGRSFQNLQVKPLSY